MANARQFRILNLTRTLNSKSVETITFKPGVNVIEGQPNTGKTTWLQTVNYLLGAEHNLEHYFSKNFISRYNSFGSQIQIGDTLSNIRRSWVTPGIRSKIILNQRKFTPKLFQEELIKLLHMPPLLYPKNDPLSDIKATTLSFRMHFRHLYRQQRFWNDLVDKQPPSEFQACVLNFFGLAERAFSKDYFAFFSFNEESKQANDELADKQNILREFLKKMLNHDSGDYEALVQLFNAKIMEAEGERQSINHLLANHIYDGIFSSIRSHMRNNEGKPQSVCTSGEIESAVVELGKYERTLGRLEERHELFNRILSITESIHKLRMRVDQISSQMKPLYGSLFDHGQKYSTDLSARTTALCNGINGYLKELNKLRHNTWPHGEVRLLFSRNVITFIIGDHSWNSVLGGTDALYFFLAYHYGLLSLYTDPECQVPGILIIDLPADLKGEYSQERESFVVEPFIGLLRGKGFENCQVIFSGHCFDSLNCHKIALTQVYMAE